MLNETGSHDQMTLRPGFMLFLCFNSSVLR